MKKIVTSDPHFNHIEETMNDVERCIERISFIDSNGNFSFSFPAGELEFSTPIRMADSYVEYLPSSLGAGILNTFRTKRTSVVEKYEDYNWITFLYTESNESFKKSDTMFRIRHNIKKASIAIPVADSMTSRDIQIYIQKEYSKYFRQFVTVGFKDLITKTVNISKVPEEGIYLHEY